MRRTVNINGEACGSSHNRNTLQAVSIGSDLIMFVWYYTVGFLLAIDVVSSQSNYYVRLVTGTHVGHGKVQVWYSSQWNSYCKRWGTLEARVTCRQLGYPDVISSTSDGSSTRSSGYGGLGYNRRSYLDCSGSEQKLSSCSLECCDYSRPSCSSVSVNCTNITRSRIRLVGGSSANEGRVELWTGYTWMSIVKSYWTSSEAKVACKQLGFIDGALSYGSSSGYTRTRYGESKSSTCSLGAECSGWEPTLNDCKNHITSSYCLHSNDVSVQCHPNRQTIECHCLTSSDCDRSTGSCPDGQCSVGWAGDYCQLELPRLSEPPRINGSVVRWDEWSFEHDIGTGPVIGYSIYYIDASQVEYEEVLIDDVEITSHHLSNLPPGRIYYIGVSCLIKTGSVTSVGPLSPTVNFTTSPGRKHFCVCEIFTNLKENEHVLRSRIVDVNVVKFLKVTTFLAGRGLRASSVT
ncbi:uncharacterized protein LOC117123650 [Anneissia japonica]|uniref:uncharacterized protein LOC117123650 n=1 Tax=Anneissia japonica TaxID=1529436 RepID=UPI0014256FD2|nr:uncharacterized protein LOC117123650 [Anneissia japonica]